MNIMTECGEFWRQLEEKKLMQLHLEKGTKVIIRNYSAEFNGLEGVVSARDGEYYKIDVPSLTHDPFLYDLFLCELEVIE